mmetsp:Transcript_22865/g.71012  ORF Transcript_22865/g.71012 Transcript_22865/m.71012 type:complete len:200 (+) Transcript_22865:373-972(+)
MNDLPVVLLDVDLDGAHRDALLPARRALGEVLLRPRRRRVLAVDGPARAVVADEQHLADVGLAVPVLRVLGEHRRGDKAFDARDGDGLGELEMEVVVREVEVLEAPRHEPLFLDRVPRARARAHEHGDHQQRERCLSADRKHDNSIPAQRRRLLAGRRRSQLLGIGPGDRRHEGPGLGNPCLRRQSSARGDDFASRECR